jgi:hypothetical protein
MSHDTVPDVADKVRAAVATATCVHGQLRSPVVCSRITSVTIAGDVHVPAVAKLPRVTFVMVRVFGIFWMKATVGSDAISIVTIRGSVEGLMTRGATTDEVPAVTVAALALVAQIEEAVSATTDSTTRRTRGRDIWKVLRNLAGGSSLYRRVPTRRESNIRPLRPADGEACSRVGARSHAARATGR